MQPERVKLGLFAPPVATKYLKRLIRHGGGGKCTAGDYL